MSIGKRLLAFILCLLMIFSLVACNADEAIDGSDTSLSSGDGSGIASGAGGYITGASKVPTNYVSIAEQETALYRIVYKSTLNASLVSKITENLTTLKAKIGVTMEAVTDAQLAAPSNLPEILIGETNRADSQTAASGLTSGEYKIKYNATTKSITIVAGDDNTLATAIDKFFSSNLELNKRYLAVPNNYSDSKTSSSTPSYATSVVMINGVPLKEYAVIYPKGADTMTMYAAQNLIDYASTNLGIRLSMTDDSKSAKQYEILIGATNRSESKISTTLGTGQYVLMQKGTKIVMQGKGIYVGAAVGTFVSKYLPKNTSKNVEINNLPTSVSAQTYKFPTTFKNAVIMIGDGMGFNHVEAAKNAGMSAFYAEQFPNKGKARTRSQSVINGSSTYTDSAAAATALATGYKTINGYVGVDKSKNTVKNIRELADEKGAKTAIVTTDVIGGATPGGFLAHNSQRKVNGVTNPAITNYINDLKTQKKVEYLMGRSEDKYSAPNPDIVKGAREALAIISKNGSQFFMMIEGAYIDKRSHQDDIEGCVTMVKQYNDVIAYMTTFVFCHPETALIVTADHETGALTAKSGAKYGYVYTNKDGTNEKGGAYRQHTNNDVPVYALGPKTEFFNGYRVENVLIPHFAAQAFGVTNFGDSTYFNSKTKL